VEKKVTKKIAKKVEADVEFAMQPENKPDVDALRKENAELLKSCNDWRLKYARAVTKMKDFHARCDGHITKEELGRAISDL
jgi:hypothetical protein